MRRHEDVLVHAGEQLAHPLLGRSDRHALLVAARRPVAEASRPETLDVDHDRFLEVVQERERRFVVLRGHPGAAPLEVDADDSVGVPAHEARATSPRLDERERLPWQRSPGEIAAEDDEIDLRLLYLFEHRRKRQRVPVNVGESSNASHRAIVRRPSNRKCQLVTSGFGSVGAVPDSLRHRSITPERESH
jgi:hypothetical protein